MSQMANNIEHLFALIGHLYILFGKCIFRSSTVFLIVNVFLLLSCESLLHILDKVLIKYRFANISYHFCKLSFHFYDFPKNIKVFNFDEEIQIIYFSFYFSCAFGVMAQMTHCLIKTVNFYAFCLFLRDLSF